MCDIEKQQKVKIKITSLLTRTQKKYVYKYRLDNFVSVIYYNNKPGLTLQQVDRKIFNSIHFNVTTVNVTSAKLA